MMRKSISQLVACGSSVSIGPPLTKRSSVASSPASRDSKPQPAIASVRITINRLA